MKLVALAADRRSPSPPSSAFRGGGSEGEAGARRAASKRTLVWALGDGADGSAKGAAAGALRARPAAGAVPVPRRSLRARRRRGPAAPLRRRSMARSPARTDPVIGNHEFKRRFEGYFPYWKARAVGRERALHRSYVDDSGWQILVYSSESDPEAEAAWVRRQVARPSRDLPARRRPPRPVRRRRRPARGQPRPGADLVRARRAHRGQPGRPQPPLRPARADRRRSRTGLRRGRPRAARAGRAAPPGRGGGDRSTDGDAAGAAHRCARLQPGRRARARVRLGHDPLRAGALSRAFSRPTSRAPSRRPCCRCSARRTRSPRRPPGRLRGSASSGRGSAPRRTARARGSRPPASSRALPLMTT